MAAGLGFKDFTTGEVLTAADVDGYLMQGVWVFANAAARTAAVTSPQEGNASFLKDTNSLEIYDGAAWVAYGAGDITGVTAGTGISGGGTSGTVTITNSMATEIAAKGDLIVGTGSATFDNLTVGANNTVLTADSSTATGLKWAAPAGGGKVLQVVSTTYSTETIIATSTYTDTGISLAITPTSATSKILILIQANVYNTRATVTAANKAKLFRGATTLLDWPNDGFNYIEITGATATRLISQSFVQYLDSPSTTSSTTYKLQAAAFSTSNSGQVIFQNGNLPSVITLLEIGA